MHWGNLGSSDSDVPQMATLSTTTENRAEANESKFISFRRSYKFNVEKLEIAIELKMQETFLNATEKMAQELKFMPSFIRDFVAKICHENFLIIGNFRTDAFGRKGQKMIGS